MESALKFDEEAFAPKERCSDLSLPLGLRVGQSTMKSILEDFIVTSEQGFSFTNGPVVEVISANDLYPEVQHILLAFDETNTLDAAWLTMDAAAYERMKAKLSQVLEVINTNDPIRGSKSVLFKLDDGQLELHAPLFSQEMTLGYSTKKFHLAKMSKTMLIYE
ncbi:hypothetical protein [Stutzerimonas decontaminans]|uniref:Uncharacterized protein n=1 Tax=Stutzerimonas stutzeri TaxID=316 RepID=A0A023WZ80_STUST|nr:hypothetical protein [Stutzerimonas decontaminans]AHY45276.1 hypothetical protein UIB01_22895 [Stutzerimonas decontaminans]